MRPESEISVYPYDVFTVLMVLVPQCLQYLDLNLALLVEFLPVLEDLDRNMLFGLVVKAPEDHTKGTSSQFLLYLIPVENLILGFVKIVRLIIVKAMIVWWTDILLRIFILTCHFIFDILTNSLVLSIQVQVVNHIVVTDLVPLVLTQVLSVVLQNIVRAHWELRWGRSSLLLADEFLLLRVLAATHNAHALLGASRIGFVLAKGIIGSLLVVKDMVNVNGLKLSRWCRPLIVSAIVSIIDGFILRALPFLPSFKHLGRVSTIIIDWRATSNRWECLLWVKFDIVHLKISLWSWSLNQPSSYCSSIGHRLRHPNIGNSKLVIDRLGLW